MLFNRGRGEGDGLIDLFKQVADGVGDLLSEHVKLAKLELRADLKTLRRQTLAIAVVFPFLVAGYVLIAMAAAFILSRSLGPAGAALLLGALHILGGGIGLYFALGKLRQTRLMDDTLNQVNQSVGVISPMQAAKPAPASKAADTTRTAKPVAVAETRPAAKTQTTEKPRA